MRKVGIEIPTFRLIKENRAITLSEFRTKEEKAVADSATVKKVRELAKPLCDGLGLFLWDVKFEKEGANKYLRVYIDSDEGISIDDCEALHRPLDKLLDEADPISESYIFEVCSAGLGRKLERPEHFEVCLGDEIRLRFIRPRDGEKELVGTLEEYLGDSVAVAVGGKREVVRISDCAYIKLNDDADLFSAEKDSAE